MAAEAFSWNEGDKIENEKNHEWKKCKVFSKTSKITFAKLATGVGGLISEFLRFGTAGGDDASIDSDSNSDIPWGVPFAAREGKRMGS